jgi:transcriptional regulator with XRE-family HTH domain
MNIAQKVRQLRESVKLTPSQLAEKSELTPAYISKLESGEYGTLTLKTSKLLANGLGLTLKSFLEEMGFLENEDRPSFKMINTALRSNGFTPEQVDKITDYAKLFKQAEAKR